MRLRRISALATQSEHERFTAVDAALLAQKSRDAAANARLREIHRLHPTDASLLQRMINAVTPGSYIRPHRHLDPPKDEAFVLLTGSLGFIFFRDDGSFQREDCVLLDREGGALAVDILAGCWHAMVALVPHSAAFEIKGGPYAAHSDKDFAPFAPAPDDPAALDYLRATEDRFRSLMGLAPRAW